MSQDSEKLNRELKFIEESFKAGIITKEEYGTAKKRVEEKLAIAKNEEEEEILELQKQAEKKDLKERKFARGEQKEASSIIKEEPKVEAYYDTVPEENEIKEPLAVKEDKPSFLVKDEKQKESKIQFETYGRKPSLGNKSLWLILISFLLLLLIVYISLNPPSFEKEEKFIPVCVTDLDCYKPGFIGTCLNASTKDATCSFKEAVPVDITILESDKCRLCDTERMKNTLMQIYPGAVYTFMDVSSVEGKDLVSKLGIDALPAYIFDSSVENAERFEQTKSMLIKKSSLYFMKPEASGASYFFNRKSVKGTELFMNPFEESSVKAYENLLKLADKRKAGFDINYYFSGDLGEGHSEILRHVCIRENFKDKFNSYMTCMLVQGMNEQDCLDKYELLSDSLSDCVENQGIVLLNQDISRANELAINTVPVFVFNNQYKKGGSLSLDLLDEAYCMVNGC